MHGVPPACASLVPYHYLTAILIAQRRAFDAVDKGGGAPFLIEENERSGGPCGTPQPYLCRTHTYTLTRKGSVTGSREENTAAS